MLTELFEETQGLHKNAYFFAGSVAIMLKNRSVPNRTTLRSFRRHRNTVHIGGNSDSKCVIIFDLLHKYIALL